MPHYVWLLERARASHFPTHSELVAGIFAFLLALTIIEHICIIIIIVIINAIIIICHEIPKKFFVVQSMASVHAVELTSLKYFVCVCVCVFVVVLNPNLTCCGHALTVIFLWLFIIMAMKE